ncbi:hypothetical protein [Anaplasma phagocytophilum]|uniref:hypothetical protein n=1 Tax=Anaplasma phagocytophilum TaxID=948 RepID=UPI00201ACC40
MSYNSRASSKKGQPKGWFHDLAAVELSAAVGVRGFTAGGSYGYLGRSWLPYGALGRYGDILGAQ